MNTYIDFHNPSSTEQPETIDQLRRWLIHKDYLLIIRYGVEEGRFVAIALYATPGKDKVLELGTCHAGLHELQHIHCTLDEDVPRSLLTCIGDSSRRYLKARLEGRLP